MIHGLLRLVLALVWCTHGGDVYRERRPLRRHPSLEVMHWVCGTCGAAWPVVKRSAVEHTQMVEIGALKPLKGLQAPVEHTVTVFDRKGRRR